MRSICQSLDLASKCSLMTVLQMGSTEYVGDDDAMEKMWHSVSPHSVGQSALNMLARRSSWGCKAWAQLTSCHDLLSYCEASRSIRGEETLGR